VRVGGRGGEESAAISRTDLSRYVLRGGARNAATYRVSGRGEEEERRKKSAVYYSIRFCMRTPPSEPRVRASAIASARPLRRMAIESRGRQFQPVRNTGSMLNSIRRELHVALTRNAELRASVTASLTAPRLPTSRDPRGTKPPTTVSVTGGCFSQRRHHEVSRLVSVVAPSLTLI